MGLLTEWTSAVGLCPIYRPIEEPAANPIYVAFGDDARADA